MGRRAKRILLPVIPVLVLELLYRGEPEHWLPWLMQGGYHYPGSYYIIILLELLVLFPVIYRLANFSHSWGGLFLVMAFHLLYEMFMFKAGAAGELYRLLVLRYGIFLYSGCLLIKEQSIISRLRWLLPISATYILATGYLGYQPSVLFEYEPWYKSAAPTAFWVVPVTAFALEQEKILRRMQQSLFWKRLTDGLILTGQSSYHIFLVQILWFGMVCNVYLVSLHKILRFILSLAICVPLGVAYRKLIKLVSAYRGKD